MPLDVVAVAGLRRVAVVDTLLHNHERELDGLGQTGLDGSELLDAHALHHAVTDTVTVHNNAGDGVVLHDDAEDLIDELLERAHGALVRLLGAAEATVAAIGAAAERLALDLHVRIGKVQPLAIGALVPRDEAGEVAALALKGTALASVGATVAVDIVADVDDAIAKAGDVLLDVDVPEGGAHLGGDVLRDVVDVGLLRLGLRHLIEVNEVRDNAELAELVLERAVGIHTTRRVAVGQHAQDEGGDTVVDGALHLGVLDGVQAVVDEVLLLLIAADELDLALDLPDTADALVDVDDLAGQVLGTVTPGEDLEGVALGVDADAHRLGSEVLVGAAGLVHTAELDVHDLEELGLHLLELGAVDLEAVGGEELLGGGLAEAADEVHALRVELLGHLGAARGEEAAGLGRELVDEDELGDEADLAGALTPEEGLGLVDDVEAVVVLVVLRVRHRGAGLELERRLGRAVLVDLVDDVLALARAVGRKHLAAEEVAGAEARALHPVAGCHGGVDTCAGVHDEHDAVVGDLEGGEVARHNNHVAVDALAGLIAVHATAALEVERLEELAQDVVVDLHGLFLILAVVELDGGDLRGAQLDGRLEGADGDLAEERLLELGTEVLDAVERVAAHDDVEGLEEVLLEHLAEVRKDELLAHDLANVLVLLNVERVQEDTRAGELHADSVPLNLLAGSTLLEGIALRGHEGATGVAVLVGPPAVPAASAALTTDVDVGADTADLATRVARVHRRVGEGHVAAGASAATTAHTATAATTIAKTTTAASTVATTTTTVIATATTVVAAIITAVTVITAVAVIAAVAVVATTTVVAAIITAVTVITAVAIVATTTVIAAIITAVTVITAVA
eukprot:PhM_4_TR13132/c0_g1_i4/m.14429